MNNDLISRSALKKKLQARYDNGEEEFNKGYNIGIKRAIDLINNAPAVEERPQGEWIKITKNGTIPVEYICSVCGRKIFDNYELSVPQSVYYPFCHCGADMKGGAENV